ncbi:hypothetical protein [Glaciihabitans sp. INWT7]|uniref:hypothetical protein n=1 Tax=Glaciihabitans sp. INWT7 TaxID=2596912 RepID=UPI00162679FA|nr:hypothetical protein [Glaciihabitans sp. INWT7]
MTEVLVGWHPADVRGGKVNDVLGELMGHPDAMEWTAEVAAPKAPGADTELGSLTH